MQQDPFLIEFSRIVNRKNALSPEHYHSYYELIYVKKGSFDIFIEDKTYTVLDGSVILIPKNVIHKASFEEDGDNFYYLIHFFEDSQNKDVLPLLKSLFSKRYLSLTKEEQAAVLSPLMRLSEEYKQDGKYSSLLIKAYLCELIVTLARSSGEHPIVRDLSVMESAIGFINKQIAENGARLNLSDLSEHFYLNPSSFSKKFKKEIGIGFKEYVISARILHAKKLIETTSQSITEIAYHCGFEDSNYFSTVFKKKEGVSPSEYAKMIGKNKSNSDK